MGTCRGRILPDKTGMPMVCHCTGAGQGKERPHISQLSGQTWMPPKSMPFTLVLFVKS